MSTQREASRKEWNSRDSIEDINGGSLQRIADAVEKMAASYDSMRESRDYWRDRAGENSKSADELRRRVSALKGALTKAKRKAKR